jgi:hypothetical protein
VSPFKKPSTDHSYSNNHKRSIIQKDVLITDVLFDKVIAAEAG